MIFLCHIFDYFWLYIYICSLCSDFGVSTQDIDTCRLCDLRAHPPVLDGQIVKPPMETFERRATRRYISGSNLSCFFSCYPSKCHNVSLFVYYLVLCNSHHSFCILLLFTIESFIHSCLSIVVIRSFQTSSLHPPKGSDSQIFKKLHSEDLVGTT